jgi:hypothetical protein
VGRGAGWAGAVVFAVLASKDAQQSFFCHVFQLGARKTNFFIITIKTLKRSNRCKKL